MALAFLSIVNKFRTPERAQVSGNWLILVVKGKGEVEAANSQQFRQHKINVRYTSCYDTKTASGALAKPKYHIKVPIKTSTLFGFLGRIPVLTAAANIVTTAAGGRWDEPRLILGQGNNVKGAFVAQAIDRVKVNNNIGVCYYPANVVKVCAFFTLIYVCNWVIPIICRPLEAYKRQWIPGLPHRSGTINRRAQNVASQTQ